ncbi:MAG: hypothetical protein Kapaf2KO_22460 [Candidatus Kapaibacteriales bacterium]
MLNLLGKEFAIELSTRFIVSSILLFVLGSAFLISFGMLGQPISPEVFSAFLWLLVYFGNVAGLGRTFISEREKGTHLLLKLRFRPGNVYFAKLTYNIVMSLAVALLATTLLFGLMQPSHSESIVGLYLIISFGAIALAAGMTIVSSIVAVAGSRSSLMPILSLPIVIPVLLLGIDATQKVLKLGITVSTWKDVGFLLGFAGTIISISYILFPQVWED